MYHDHGFGLRRLRARADAMGDQLRRLEINNGVPALNIDVERRGGRGGVRNRGAGVRRGANGRNRRGGGGGGGGDEDHRNIIQELRNLNLDDQAVNAIRIAVYDNDARESEREIDVIRVQQRRQRARYLERERRLEQSKLEKAAVKNLRRDIAIADADRELEAERRQLDAERAMRRN